MLSQNVCNKPIYTLQQPRREKISTTSFQKPEILHYVIGVQTELSDGTYLLINSMAFLMGVQKCSTYKALVTWHSWGLCPLVAFVNHMCGALYKWSVTYFRDISTLTSMCPLMQLQITFAECLTTHNTNTEILTCTYLAVKLEVFLFGQWFITNVTCVSSHM